MSQCKEFLFREDLKSTAFEIEVAHYTRPIGCLYFTFFFHLLQNCKVTDLDIIRHWSFHWPIAGRLAVCIDACYLLTLMGLCRLHGLEREDATEADL